MHKLLTSLAACLLSVSVWAVQTPPKPIEACAAELPYGIPTSVKEHTVKFCRTAYAVEYDLQAKIPVWVSYVLTPEEAVGCLSRTNAFTPDYSLPPEARSTLKDYKRSGYDTDHMANDADMRWDLQAEEESFLLSNMTPQLPGFNRGVWKRLEDSSRGWVLSRQHPILIYAGSIYASSDKIIGAGVRVPAGFFKVLVDTVTAEAQVYVFQHRATTEPLTSFLGSLADVQLKAGVTLPMPSNVTVSTTGWPRTIKSNKKAKAEACALKP